MSKINNYINHIVFVIDRSGSMRGIGDEVVKVFDSQVEFLAQRSKEADQETRVSVYLFNGSVECLVYDKDVLRLPSLKSFYQAEGSTALIDGTYKAIEDLEKTATLYGDHAFLIYVLTDGQNTDNNQRGPELAKKISSLPENWTLGVLVPDQTGVYEAKKFGFPLNNIQVWAADNKGIREVGETLKTVTANYMTARASGVRGTKSLFSVDTSSLSSTVVKNLLDELKTNEYTFLPVRKDAVIKDFVEAWKLPFVQGANYYELTKPETVQANKQVAVQNKRNGKVYSGLNARKIIGLPNQEVKVSPSNYGEWNLFIQSNSINRKLVGGTQLLVLK